MKFVFSPSRRLTAEAGVCHSIVLNTYWSFPRFLLFAKIDSLRMRYLATTRVLKASYYFPVCANSLLNAEANSAGLSGERRSDKTCRRNFGICTKSEKKPENNAPACSL
mgnify:CR=1 FL=1